MIPPRNVRRPNPARTRIIMRYLMLIETLQAFEFDLAGEVPGLDPTEVEGMRRVLLESTSEMFNQVPPFIPCNNPLLHRAPGKCRPYPATRSKD